VANGATVAAARRFSADTVVMSERAGGDDASQSSSPHSPPGKKVRANVEPYRFTHVQLQQRGPRPGTSRQEEPAPADEGEDIGDRRGGGASRGADAPPPAPDLD